MARITKPNRRSIGSKKLDLTDMKHVFQDRRMWSAIGVVTKPDDGEHFEEVEGPADVLVEVVLQPALVPVTCRLAAGIWAVPSVGEEVAVLIPEGQPAFMPIIVALLSSNVIPGSQGPAVGRIAIVRGEVVVHDGSGGAVALAKKSDVDALATHVDAHTHNVPGVTAGPTTVPTLVPLTTSPAAVGTTVLKGK